MRIAYDAEVDILTIDLDSKSIEVSEEVLPGVVADFGNDGRLMGFEIMDASKFTDFSQVKVFMSQWGDEDRVLDSSCALSVLPRTIKTQSAGD